MAALGLEYAKRLAVERAKKVDPIDSEGKAWDAESFVEGVFFNFWIGTESVDRWDHVSAMSLSETAGKWGINREELKSSAEHYIENLDWLHDRHIDWLLADMLAYAELDAFLLHSNKHLHFNYSKKALFGVLLAKAGWSLLKWLIWIAIVIFGFAVNTWVGVVLTVITVAVQTSQYLQRRKIARLTMSMVDVYTAISSPTLSWSVVWDLMKKSRDLGAVWDPQLYRLVELRMHTRPAPN